MHRWDRYLIEFVEFKSKPVPLIVITGTRSNILGFGFPLFVSLQYLIAPRFLAPSGQCIFQSTLRPFHRLSYCELPLRCPPC